MTSRAALAFALAVGIGLSPALANAADKSASEGLRLAKKGDCVKAIPLLEEAELGHHKPSTAVALGNCYVSAGDLLKAYDVLHAVAEESPTKTWNAGDYQAQKTAKKKSAELDARIPTLTIELPHPIEKLAVTIDGQPVGDPTEPHRVASDKKIHVVAKAPGYDDYETRLVLEEGAKKTLKINLVKIAEEDDAQKPKEAAPPPKSANPTWLGFRYRGAIIPQFLVNAFVDGGTTIFAPGGAVTLTTHASDADVVFGLGYMSYRMGPTAMKGKDAPDTEWEFVESTLNSLVASVDLMFNVPLNDTGTVAFRIGGSVGVGWTFLGDLSRTQSYPKNGKAGDPDTYLPCRGPNNPVGTYRYCNKLDKDATHYPGYTEPNWFQGGKRPLIYPWLTLPQLGLTFKPSQTVAIDVEVGTALTGIVTSAGVRFAL